MTEHRFEQNQPLSISDTETIRSEYFNRQPLYAILSEIYPHCSSVRSAIFISSA